MSGVIQFIDNSDGTCSVNGKLSHMPLKVALNIEIMEFGDFSSLAVEYPDYNSLGSRYMPIGSYQNNLTTSEAFKFNLTLQYPSRSMPLSELTGRAIIVTLPNGDLLAYGLLVNETFSQNGSLKLGNAQAVAICENFASTITYRAIFFLEQSNDKVTFNGMLRTSVQMEEDDELIISLNHREAFDIDFESAYTPGAENKDFNKFMHPCYVINKETVDNQDWIVGRNLFMFGQHDLYNTKILDTSTCHIGVRNPSYRVSDESFCFTEIELNGHQSLKRYTAETVINFLVIGFGKIP